MEDYIDFITTVDYIDNKKAVYRCEDYSSALGYYSSAILDKNVKFASISYPSGKIAKSMSKDVWNIFTIVVK